MQTHETKWVKLPEPDGYHRVVMTFSSKNAFGGRVTAIAIGEVHPQDCRVRLIEIIE